MKGYNLLLNTIAAVVIGLSVIGLILITIKSLNVEEPKTNTILIEYHGVKTDSINELNKMEIIKIDSLLKEIKETSNKIQNRQLDLIQEKENDNFFNKLYAAIVAIILAIAGFFGFKSTNDIRSRAVEEAKIESTKIAKDIAEQSAKEEFKTIFDEEYKGEVFEQATKASSKVLRKEVGELEKTIFKLTKRIDKLETTKEKPSESEPIDPDESINIDSDDNGTDNGINETENPFDNEQ
jgi:hypothetical protein